ncbi:Uu.00g091550.m01.CDS01 [Anthostomella pinea]|uniref:Uu.00g091550.m01.CDS01 n=1 Tax=Anthostomella pinea TaxID=933095 RepID=A0AAI8VN52_9PEZI|nr:Uu.00g091550.m01.CDS01 [Anthostomella pinea]
MPQLPSFLDRRRIRHSPSQDDIETHSSSKGVRSLAAFQTNDAKYGGGADIPDIPRRPARGTRPVAESMTPPTARVANPSLPLMDVRNQEYRRRPESSRNNMSPSPDAIFIPTMTESGDNHDTETRSPSTAPRSLMSRSTKSQANSSTSSLAPTHGSALPGLQSRGPLEYDGLEPLAEEEFDPASFDLVAPARGGSPQYALETTSELLFSTEHLRVIFDDPLLLQRFTNFLCASRPSSVPLLVYYLDSLKALKAIGYANAIAEALTPIEGLQFSYENVAKTVNDSLQAQATKAFEVLAREDLAAYITHTYVQSVSLTIKRRIANTLPAHLRDLSEGLAEVFCLSDPSRPDNPIVFASEEFNKTTQYGMGYVLGRNCRFLQGPKTNPASVRRLREMLAAGKEHCETFLNYRRDGSPFMNLLMVAPLFDSRGNVRYFIGAQVDVSGLVKECAGLESLERLVAQKHDKSEASVDGSNSRIREHGNSANGQKDEFRELAEMLNLEELKTVRESGGILYRVHQEDMGEAEQGSNWRKPRLLINDDAALDRHDSDPLLQIRERQSVSSLKPSLASGGRLRGVYENYLLVRPHPSLRILFASPSMRVPGMLQSSFMGRIGGSLHVRDAIAHAMADGSGVTAKVRWISTSSASSSAGDGPVGKARWIHATPLLGANGAVGVWMVVLVDDEANRRRTRDAPPVEMYTSGRRPFDHQQVDAMSLSSFAAVSGRVMDEQQQHQNHLSTNVLHEGGGRMRSTQSSLSMFDDGDFETPRAGGGRGAVRIDGY